MLLKPIYNWIFKMDILVGFHFYSLKKRIKPTISQFNGRYLINRWFPKTVDIIAIEQ